jgi:WD40 repeat protein/serine/threonine protein kinase
MGGLVLNLFGPLRIEQDGQEIDLKSRKGLAMVVYLAVEADRRTRDSLASIFWPDYDQSRARANLRSTLFRLNQTPLSKWVQADSDTVAIHPEQDDFIDVFAFNRLIESGKIKNIQQAVSYYRGDFLSDFYLEDSNAFEDWATIQREAHRRRVLEGLHKLADYYLQQLDFTSAEAAAHRQLEIDNLAESAWRQLMETLARDGRRSEAIAQYEKFQKILYDELSVDPSPETQALYEAILASNENTSQHIRGFELQEQIGESPFGVVFRAYQSALRRDVAVKVISSRYSNDPNFVRHFEADAQRVARLEHPNIVPLYDYWREPGRAFLVMPLMHGGNLGDKLKEGHLDLTSVIKFTQQIASALAIAHRQGIVHTDLKPTNILLDEDGNAYLTDFGITRAPEGKNDLDDHDQVHNPHYASPEQLLGEPTSAQSDIYSLGMIVYELLSGEHPFAGGTLTALVAKHLNDSLPPLGGTLTSYSPEIETVIQRATAKKPSDRFPDILSFAEALRLAAKGDESESRIKPIPLLDVANPYKGLHPYMEADQDLFFGRQNLITQLLQGIAESRFMAVVGPSGSGKSSVVRAGLIPALRQGALPKSDTWFISEMFPGTHPLEEMEAALLRVAVDSPPTLLPQLQEDERGLARVVKRILPPGNGELLLVIDQFEEIFTLVEHEDVRQHVLNSLLSIANDSRSRARIIITLRADFYDRPLRFHAFGELMQRNTRVVIPPTKEELEEAVRRPAELVGTTVESKLITAIVNDVYDHPGAFPLLQYALTEVFERRQNHSMTLSDYESIGGVAGALGRRAEDLFDEFDELYQVITQQVFLRLVSVSDGVLATRRRVLRSDLDSIAQVKFSAPLDSVNRIIDAYGRYRLLSFDHARTTRAPTIEIAHEALLSAWPRLEEWIKTNQDDLRQQQHLGFLAQEWLDSGKSAGFLLRESRLDQFTGWAANTQLALNTTEQAYLEASLAARLERQAEEEARQQRELETAQRLAETERQRAQEQAQTASRLSRRALYLAGALLVAAIMAAAALIFGQQANRNALAAEQQAQLATSRELSSAALNNLEIDPERSILLALQALDTAYTLESESALHQAVQASRVVRRYEGHESDVTDVAYSPDGQFLATSSNDGTSRLWDRSNGQTISTFTGHTAGVFNLDYHPGGELVASSGEDGSIKLWEPLTGQELASLSLETRVAEDEFGEQGTWVEDTAFSPDGRWLAAGNYRGTVKIWDLESKTGQASFQLPEFTNLAFNPAGDQVATAHGFETGTVTIWEIEGGTQVLTMEHGIDINDLVYSPDGAYLVSSGIDGVLIVWDAGTGEQLARKDVGGELYGMAFDPSGNVLAAAHPNGTVLLFETGSLEELQVLSGHTAGVNKVAFSPDGMRLASAGMDSTAREWDIGPSHELLTITDEGGPLRVAYSPDGQYLATTNYAGSVSLWDAGSGDLIWQQAGHETFVGGLDFSPDGTLIASSSDIPPVIIFWDAKTGEQVRKIEGHSNWVNNVRFNPDGTLLASTSADQTVRLWSLDGAQTLSIEHPRPAWGIDFHPDGERFATSPWDANRAAQQAETSLDNDPNLIPDERLAIWDLDSGEMLSSLGPHPAAVRDLAFTQSGDFLAAGDWDGVLTLWNITTGEQAFSVEAFTHTIFRVAFSPDDARIAVVGEATKVWDAKSGEHLLTLQDHSDVIFDLAFSPDGRHLTTASVDGTVRVHVLDLEELRELAKSRLTRSWTPDECRQYLHTSDCPVSN